MADKTGISWTNATWNPVTGCVKVSQACKFCYAERDWARLANNPKTIYFNRKFTDVATHEDRLDQPLRWSRQRMIFVNSMSDLFHEDVPVEFIDKVFAVMGLNFIMRDHPHIFQVLTKRPERMHAYLNDPGTVHRVTAAMKALGPGLPGENAPPVWPLPNVWIGVSVEDQEAADLRIPLLLDTPAAVRWISAEPLLAPLSVSKWLASEADRRKGLHKHLRNASRTKLLAIASMVGAEGTTLQPALDWVVVGGESGGAKARPMHPYWARQLRDECVAAKTPFFFKQWGEWAPRIGALHTLTNGQSAAEMDPDMRRWDFIDLNPIGKGWDGSPSPETDIMQRVGRDLSGDFLFGQQHHEWPAMLEELV
jgi:protein gp37